LNLADVSIEVPQMFCSSIRGIKTTRRGTPRTPPLTDVLDEDIGPTWSTDISKLSELKKKCAYPQVHHEVRQAKQENKKRLALVIAQQLTVVVNPTALFAVQIMRLHDIKPHSQNVLLFIARINFF
uniref:glycogen/starch/alpha-glucan phosphorylase n=1 Tax=Salmonella enterica TaxID=28901 RepID=UPI00398C7D05